MSNIVELKCPKCGATLDPLFINSCSCSLKDKPTQTKTTKQKDPSLISKIFKILLGKSIK